MEFTDKQIEELNSLNSYVSFKESWIYRQFMNNPSKIMLWSCGNQFGKTATVARSYVARILGLHPIAIKNVVYWECSDRTQARLDKEVKTIYLTKHKNIDSATWNYLRIPKDNKCPECGGDVIQHKRGSRVIRFCSETLPGQSANVSETGESAEVKNTQYPELKKWLPSLLIKKDITARNPAIIVKDIFGGTDIIIEFISYNQSIQSTAGPQRMSIWCVAKGQRVLMSDGVWRNIENLKGGDELVSEALGGYGIRQRTNKVMAVINNGNKPVYRFNCQKGISFNVTKNHLIMIPRLGKSTYKKAEDLKVGDTVVCKLSNIANKNVLPTWKVALLGAYLGDGSMGHETPKISCGNEKIIRSLEEMLPQTVKIKKKIIKGRVPDYFIQSYHKRGKNNEFKNFLFETGLFHKKASEKFIPDIIFREGDKNISTILCFLFATDGWANGHSIGYCSTSYRLAQDVFLLLRRLGIRSNINKREFNNGWSIQWWIMISKATDVLRFADKIGIAGKSDNLKNVVKEAERRIAVGRFGKHRKNLDDNKTNVKIKSIEFVGNMEVFDITMKSPKRKDGSALNNFLIQGGVVAHNCDEQPDIAFLEEQHPRLLAEDGDLLITCTPADRLTHLYDSIFERAKYYFRTKTIADKFKLKQFEKTDSIADIAVFQAATDDNPTLAIDDIEKRFANEDDPDVITIRRYGIFKQISGRIFKSFDWNVHYILKDKWFPDGVPYSWSHFRGIDYHEHNRWACGMMAISPEDEVFIYGEFSPNPEEMVTIEIAREFALMGKDYKYILNLIDPWASKTQSNTGLTVIDDLNRSFLTYKKEGIGTGAYWRPWDTKSTRGRDELRKRVKNSALVGKPFNNVIVKDGLRTHLPTLWVLDNCKQTAKSFKNWRLEEWAINNANATKDANENPQQRYSHFPMVFECLFKDPACKARKNMSPFQPQKYEKYKGNYAYA